ncbi:hypothetical protein ACPRNU_07400 [Chromobacterium vaccinii]|uniref:hypothetical protein n=1 Tax=Chromobacterium vaccinii TaxID=1108595 RepID=UPI003C737133
MVVLLFVDWMEGRGRFALADAITSMSASRGITLVSESNIQIGIQVENYSPVILNRFLQSQWAYTQQKIENDGQNKKEAVSLLLSHPAMTGPVGPPYFGLWCFLWP